MPSVEGLISTDAGVRLHYHVLGDAPEAVGIPLACQLSEDLIPLASSRERVDELPQARLLAVDGAGHYPHLEAPEAFFGPVEAFLAGRWHDGAM